MRTLLLSLSVLFLVIGCVAPRTTVQAIDGRSTLIVKDAPKGAVLLVDGVVVGSADTYSGEPSVLLVEPGTHLVEVRLGDRLLVSQRTFFGGGEMRTIAVPGASR